MRGFIVLCLSAVALAAPQGYNYNPVGGAAQQTSAFGGNFGGNFGGASGGFNAISTGSGFSQGVGHHQQAGFVQQQQHISGVAQHQQQQQQQQQQAIISKRFFIHSAPEETEEELKERHITVGVPKKNYNVVFIKAPAKSNKKTSIKISPAVNEEKTVIYVLSKKTDASDIHAEVLEHAAPTAKPEVFFIKYKTNEEAAHAQQEIQAQYDALGGSSQVSDEGVAPVTSVIGSLGGDANAAHGTTGAAAGSSSFSSSSGSSSFSSGSHSSHTNNAYLPPNFY